MDNRAKNIHLNGRDKAPKETNHSKEFCSAKILDNKLLSNIGNSIHYRTTQDQDVPNYLIFACKIKEKTNASNYNAVK